MMRTLIICGLALFLLAGVSTDTLAGGKKAKHPKLHDSLHELREARTELKEAAHNFGGHRAKALDAVERAIKQIEFALKEAGDNIKGNRDKNDEWYKKYEHHPRIHHAVAELKEARKELRDAKGNFGGHREAALREINNAIDELELALKHARKK